MDILTRDLQLAWRGLRRAPGFTAAVIAMLALAIGATTAVWTVVHGALLRPLPHFDVARWADVFERPVNDLKRHFRFDAPAPAPAPVPPAQPELAAAATTAE